MSQGRSKRQQQPPPRDVRPFWVERGYRPEIATSLPSPNEDPKGEEAYQRAFAETAKADPPRLPNPQWYPNSASAQAYIRRRDIDFMAPRGSKRTGDEQQASQQNARRLRDPDRSPLLSAIKQNQDSSPTTNFISNPRLPAPAAPPSSIPRMSDQPPASQLHLSAPTASSQQSFVPPRLATMEPYGGPSGPINKLRWPPGP